MFTGCLTLHAGETPTSEATGVHIRAAATDVGAPFPSLLTHGSGGDYHLGVGLVVEIHV